MRVLVSGAAGFIGLHVSKRLLEDGYEVVGIDSLSDYYSVELKRDRLKLLEHSSQFHFVHGDIADAAVLVRTFQEHLPEGVIHLAAQPGIRYSLTHPEAYIHSNLVGFANVIECCRRYPVKHFVFASSSSVYGANRKLPFAVTDPVDHPISLYAATKKSNELMSYSYAHLYGIPSTGLRFFTVYGPWGRPDMAPMIFIRKIIAREDIEVFNHGKMQRDFTYIDDIVEGVIRVFLRPPGVDDNGSPFALYNIGNNRPVELLHFIEVIETNLGIKAIKQFLPLQAGDVVSTAADIEPLRNAVGFEPKTPVEEGIPRLIEWYLAYYTHTAI